MLAWTWRKSKVEEGGGRGKEAGKLQTKKWTVAGGFDDKMGQNLLKRYPYNHTQKIKSDLLSRMHLPVLSSSFIPNTAKRKFQRKYIL
jgi:hypothetical protein